MGLDIQHVFYCVIAGLDRVGLVFSTRLLLAELLLELDWGFHHFFYYDRRTDWDWICNTSFTARCDRTADQFELDLHVFYCLIVGLIGTGFSTRLLLSDVIVRLINLNWIYTSFTV